MTFEIITSPIMKYLNSRYEYKSNGDQFIIYNAAPEMELKLVDNEKFVDITAIHRFGKCDSEWFKESMRNYVNTINSLLPLFIGAQSMLKPSYEINFRTNSVFLKATISKYSPISEEIVKRMIDETTGYFSILNDGVKMINEDNIPWYYAVKHMILRYSIDDNELLRELYF